MIKKSIPKSLNFLPKFLTQNLVLNSKRIVIAILLAVLFLPSIVLAQTPSPAPTPTPTPTNQTCDLTRLNSNNARADYAFEPSANSPIHPDQIFQVGVKITNIQDQQLLEACRQSNIKIKVEFYFYSCLKPVDYIACHTGVGPALAIGTLEGTAKIISGSDGQPTGFGGLFDATSLSRVMIDQLLGRPYNFSSVDTLLNNQYVYAYPRVFISETNFTTIPFGDNYAFYRQVSLDAPVGSPGAVSPDFAPTTENTAPGSGGLVGSLFNFLRDVFAYTVLLLTSFVYYIFSVILVPVIVALLQIKPYQDIFVNFIYPGWVIIRNISNIFFIVALLWIGLRTLFQLDDAGKSRSLIIRLILMALLVNFSLVIGQAIVGIADTVQSQFLPADTKVVEALGHKLMVEPIQTFRGVESTSDNLNLTSSSAISGDAVAADLPKSIVLLILAVASFFAFVALIAFLTVRLAALWILYMLSPLAYVGRILPQTQKYADQWWSQFIKYAFAVPIMAFFLNITALMAVTFSRQTGNVVQPDGSSTTMLWGLIDVGSMAGSYVGFAVTVMSHFIVLVFLFIGMKFALSFGGAGAEKIVGAAKTGFKKAFEWPWRGIRAGADIGADSLAKREFASKRPWLSTAIRAAARPGEAFTAAKKGYWDNPKKQMGERFAKSFDSMLNKRLQPWGEDKLFPFKMAAWKASGGSPSALMAQAAAKREQAGILLDTERTELSDKYNELVPEYENELEKLQSFEARDVSVEDGEKYLHEIGEYTSTLSTDLASLEKQKAQADKNGDKYNSARLANQISDKTAERDRLYNAASELGLRRTAAINAGSSTFSIAGLEDYIKPVIDIDTIEAELAGKVNGLEAEMEGIEDRMSRDIDLRNKYGIETTAEVTAADRERLIKESDELVDTAHKREWPFSSDLAGETVKEVLAKKKELADLDLDYKQMEVGFTSALKKNNEVEARAYLKLIGEKGDMDKLLKSRGEFYNIDGIKSLIEKNFQGSRNQISIIREVTNTAAKSGNAAIGFAVKSFASGSGTIKPLSDQLADVSKKVQKMSVKEWKKGDILYYDPDTNQERLVPGVVETLKKNNNAEKAKVIERDVDRDMAKAIYDNLSATEKESIGNFARGALENIISGVDEGKA